MVIGAISVYWRQPGQLAVTVGDTQVLADAIAELFLCAASGRSCGTHSA
jgi:hypothetical protein